ncbi:MAG TPA: hypothetical protein VJO34_17215 [Methylomirabilota bacterium]|nr:hypothetical protein [Methylomirabilota bacterium]
MEQKQGLIAILDALGAARYNDQEISRFLDSRERVLELLRRKANAKAVRGDIDASLVTTFTFNDTVLIVYRTPEPATVKDVEHFCLLLRKFAVDSLAQGILFRGAVSVGRFYVDDESNTVMGTAVTDAAAWYDAADWVGISATPYATLTIQALLEPGRTDLDHLLVDYPVPIKDRSTVILKAINWPKAFVVKGLRPVADGEDARAKCLSLLTEHGVPKGTESKHFNSVAFFDHCIALWNKQRKDKRRQAG